MKAAFKHTYLLLLALSLTLILADYNFNGNAFSNLSVNTHRECSHLPHNSHHSNTVCFDDELLIGDCKVKSTEYIGYNELVPTFESNFESRYTSSIWQPPKFS